MPGGGGRGWGGGGAWIKSQPPRSDVLPGGGVAVVRLYY